MSKHFIFAVVVVTACLSLMVSGVARATVISNNFSIGYGYTPSSWNTSETASVNTDVTGDFTLGITFAPSVSWTSGPGPNFINRVLSNDTQGNSEGRTDHFDLSVTASYTGLLTDSDIRLVIDNIRIYAGNHTNSGLTNVDTGGSDLINWIETTVGHTGSGPLTNLGAGSSAEENISSYDLVSWNPDDYTASGTMTTRQFDLQTNGQLQAYLDGFEIFGHVEFVSPVPEPATHWLLVCGIVGLAKRVRRRRGSQKHQSL